MYFIENIFMYIKCMEKNKDMCVERIQKGRKKMDAKKGKNKR